jgi:hypothetical protein
MDIIGEIYTMNARDFFVFAPSLSTRRVFRVESFNTAITGIKAEHKCTLLRIKVRQAHQFATQCIWSHPSNAVSHDNAV